MRMIPPQEIKYFFSFGDHHVRIAKDQPIWLNYMSEANLDIHDNLIVNIPKLNYHESSYLKKSLINEEFLQKMAVKPRPEPKFPIQRIRPKTPWDFNKSIFAPYRSDTKDLLNRCFDIDWDNSKIAKILKNDPNLEEIQEFLRTQYREVRECYKNYAGISPSNQVFCITKTLFNEIINSIHPSIVDNNLTLTAIDLEFITTISGIKGGKLNPNRDLIRYQFLEIWVRLAIHKYFKTNIWKTRLEAITKFFNEDLGNYLKKFKSYEWREQRYFCEDVEYILKEYMEELEELFKMYSGKYTMPSKPKFVSLEEFTDMITRSGVCKLNIANKDIGKFFNLSLQTEPDELENEKHMQMFNLEFYEAIARIADKVWYDSKRDRKDTIDFDSDAIKIENDDFNLLEEDDESMKSDNEENMDYMRTTSTKMIPKEYIVHLGERALDVIDENSAYSLGDSDKLYQKLEQFIKVLIENWFKKDPKRFNKRLSNTNLVSPNKKTRSSLIENVLNFDPKTPNKNYLRQHSFTNSSGIIKGPLRHHMSQINLLQVGKP